jgi:hypothetical protein
VFENKMLRRIFESKRQEVRGGWRNMNNEDSSSTVLRVIKHKMMRQEDIQHAS